MNINKISENDVNVIITTDHGTINVKKPIKIMETETSTNLRYKQEKI